MLGCAGAVSMRTGTCVRSLHSTFDAAAFEPFLKRLLRHSSRGTRLVMLSLADTLWFNREPVVFVYKFVSPPTGNAAK